MLIHIEVQSHPDPDFPQRMYVYNYRLRDRYNRTVVSLAVLADDRADWRPNQFRSSLWGCTAGLEFPVAKLQDYAAQDEVLERNANPFATLVAGPPEDPRDPPGPGKPPGLEAATGAMPVRAGLSAGGRSAALRLHRLADGASRGSRRAILV